MKIDVERSIYLTGELDEDIAEQVIDDLFKLDSVSTEPIYLLISTSGGCTYSMFAIHDVMRTLRSNVYTVAVGKAMSSGALLLAAGRKRFAYENSYIMLHEIQGLELGSMGVAELKAEALHTDHINRRMIELLAKYTGQENGKIEKDLDRQSCLYLTAKEALNYGLVDEIVEPPTKHSQVYNNRN
jgi:ATP-dependent Clp protease protease subunit